MTRLLAALTLAAIASGGPAQALWHLRMPIDGVPPEAFQSGFLERRASHAHEAVDIPAPRNTPVHAVDVGTIAKLFFSKGGGGNTVRPGSLLPTSRSRSGSGAGVQPDLPGDPRPLHWYDSRRASIL